MAINGMGHSYQAALQTFCDNHNITKITGKELAAMTGYAPIRCSKVLKNLGWEMKRRSHNVAATFLKRGAGKMFRRDYHYYRILRIFEAHYEKVKQ